MKKTVEFKTSGGRLEVEAGNGQTLFSVIEKDGACYRASVPFELSERATLRVEENRFDAKITAKSRGLEVHLRVDFKAPGLGEVTRTFYVAQNTRVSLNETPSMPEGNVVFVTTLDGIVMTLLEKSAEGHTVVFQKDDKTYTAFVKTPYDLADNVAFRQGFQGDGRVSFVIDLPFDGKIKERMTFFHVDFIGMKLEFDCVLHGELV